MTKIGDLLGDFTNKIAQNNIKIGDVHMLVLDKSNGITPKDGKETRDKFFYRTGI